VDRIEAEANQAIDRSNESGLPKALPPDQSEKDQLTSIPQPGEAIGISAPASKNQLKSNKSDSNLVTLKPTNDSKPLKQPDPEASQGPDLTQLKATATKLAGVSFYDPKRPHKYWASSNMQYDSIQQAIAALAGQYHMPSDWIEKNMGDTNDLGVIYQNLIAGLQGGPSEPTLPLSASPDIERTQTADAGQRQSAKAELPQPTAVQIENLGGPKTEGPIFYDPRRALKYWISESSGYKTLKEALMALAQMYDRPPDWIEAHMGQSNDLNEIHRNLQQNSEK
jgi:hypothetical protein